MCRGLGSSLFINVHFYTIFYMDYLYASVLINLFNKLQLLLMQYRYVQILFTKFNSFLIIILLKYSCTATK